MPKNSKINMMKENLNEPIDVIEQKINNISPSLLNILIKDNTTKEKLRWATNTYEKHGELYAPQNAMSPELLIGPNINLLTPRVSKSQEEQQARTKDKGEVFTPAWMCNMQVNFLDEDWFGRKNVFNTEIESGWKTNKKKITFAKTLKKTWQEYVSNVRLEITCGEAPYLVSRYDVVKGEIIPVEDRIGILDRKLRIINENADDEEMWLEQAEIAYQSTYGYDYQGDNVLIARENLLYTLIDNMVFKFGHQPDTNTLKKFATIISWNIWQMDGLDYTIPYSEQEVQEAQMQLDLFADEPKEVKKEKVPAKIKNWETSKTIEFKELVGGKKMKFDYTIGNPPYQGDKHMQLYPHFYLGCRKISNCVELIFPIGWQGPKNAKNLKYMNNEEVKRDKQIVFIDNRQNVFPGVTGAEWTNIIMWKKDYDNKLNGKQLIFNNGNDPKEVLLDIDALTCKYELLNNVVLKVLDENFISIMNIIKLQTKLDLQALYNDYPELEKQVGSDGKEKRIVTNSFEALPVFSSIFDDEHDVAIYGIINFNRVKKYISHSYLDDKDNHIEKYKVILPAAGYGVINDDNAMPIISEPFIGKPNDGFSQSFISFGEFDNEDDAIRCSKYIKTKFLRAIVGTLKTSQHNHREVFQNVPLQNFTNNSDVDWSKSTKEIDQQLYTKYNLSKDEIDFIESHVKEMQ